MNIANRLARIEGQLEINGGPTHRHVFHLVMAQGDDEAGHALARSHDWRDDDEGHYLIVNSIVSPAGQPRYSPAPYMLHVPSSLLSTG